MENLKWLNLQEERITSALEENLRRKQFLEDELNVIQNLKKMVQGNTTEADCPENQFWFRYVNNSALNLERAFTVAFLIVARASPVTSSQ